MLHELNLLPPERRQTLSRQRFISVVNRALRNFVVGLGALTLCGVLAALFIQGLVFTFSKTSNVGIESQIMQYDNASRSVMRTNSVLKEMRDSNTNRVVWSDLLNDLFSVFLQSVTIEKISGKSADDKSISFDGQAISRNSLIVFEDRLNDLPWVARVDSPNSNLVQRVNPTFTFDIVLKGSEKQDAQPTLEETFPAMEMGEIP